MFTRNRETNTVIVFGPPGCGKTINSQRLAKFFRCNGIRDGWSPGQSVERGFLHLSTVDPGAVAGAKVVAFELAIKFAGEYTE